MTSREAITIAPGAVVPEDLVHGSGCSVGAFAYVGSGCRFETDVHIGARATLTSPAAVVAGTSAQLLIRSGVTIEPGAIVAGATIIERGALVKPGAVVTSDVPPYAIVAGNPAHVIGYSAPSIIDGGAGDVYHVQVPAAAGATEIVGGASIVRLPEVVDLRGTLSYGEVGGLLPFEVERFFLVYGVPSRSIRGEHAHRTLQEFLIAVSGSVRVTLTDGKSRSEVLLDSPHLGLHLPTMIWAAQYAYDPDTVLLVLASHKYDPSSYIRDFDEFLREVG